MGQHLAFLVWTKASQICITKPSQTSPWISDLEKRGKFSESTPTENSQCNLAYYCENSVYSPKRWCMQHQHGLSNSFVTLGHAYCYLFWDNFSNQLRCRMLNLNLQWQWTVKKCFLQGCCKGFASKGRNNHCHPFLFLQKQEHTCHPGIYTNCL